MSWQAIAKKDVKDSVRSKGLWLLIGSFLVFTLFLSWAASPGSASDPETILTSVGFSYFFGILFFVPLAGLFISIKSIARERESGTINLLLSLPHSRFDMVLGKFVGRSIVMSIAIFATFLPANLYLLTQVGFDSDALFVMVALLLAIALFGLMFVAIGVGFSALVSSETMATAAGVGLFFFLYLWIFIVNVLGISTPTFVDRFWLFAVFSDIVVTLIGLWQGDIGNPSVVWGASELASFDVEEGVASPAFYMQDWFVFVILSLWIVVPLAIGYLRFNRMDL